MSSRFYAVVAGLSFVGMAALYGCSDDDDDATTAPSFDAGADRGPVGDTGAPDTGKDSAAGPTTYKARATLAATGLSDAGTVTGTVDFDETNGNVAIAISISGATPGDHGMHIHAGSSCDAIDGGAALAAGGHWNPADAGHGYPDSGSHHPGDFGNISIADGGTGTSSLSSTAFNVQPDGGANSAIGHAVIFHQGVDDGTTQPTGNSGGRAGCGIIQVR